MSEIINYVPLPGELDELIAVREQLSTLKSSSEEQAFDPIRMHEELESIGTVSPRRARLEVGMARIAAMILQKTDEVVQGGDDE